MRTSTAAAVAVLTLTLTACGSSDDGDDKPEPATSTASATPTTAPSLSQEEIAAACSEAVAEAAPGWDDWNVNPSSWQDDPRTPEVCLGLADERFPHRGNRAYMDAFREGLEMADDPRARQ
jgi:hypothetical protein